MSNNTSGNLGRGLGELFNEAAYARTTIPAFEEGYAKIPASQIDLPDWMAARNRNGAALDDLAESIRAHGILQPLLVEKNDDRYTVASGARRYAAALRAGTQSIPVLIIPGSENDLLGIYLAENIQQLCFNFDDNAPEMTALCEHFNISAEELRERIQQLASHTLQKALEEQAEATLVDAEEPVTAEQTFPPLPETPPPLPEPEERIEDVATDSTATEETNEDNDRFKPWFFAAVAALIISIVITVIAFGTRHVETIEVEKTVFVEVPQKTQTEPTPNRKPIPAQTIEEEAPAITVVKEKQPNVPLQIETSSAPKQKAALPTQLLATLRMSGVTISGTPQQLNITFEQPVFSYRSEINSEAKELLQKLSAAILPYAEMLTVQVTGHTDDDPITTSAYFSNYDLGLQRAAAVAEYLHRAGTLSTTCISARSDGELSPPFSNAQPATKRKNRTVTIQLIPLQQ